MRWWLLAVFALGCAGPAYPAGPTPAVPEVGAGPETLAERAERVLATVERLCDGQRTDACAAHVRPDIYPDAEVPAVVQRFVTSQQQELRTLGFELRWDPGTRSFDLVAGNTLSHRGDPSSDP